MHRLFFSIALSIVLSSCTTAPIEPMAGNYPGNISTIIGANCLGGNCHSGPSTDNTEFDLSTWDAMIKGSEYFNEIIPFNAVKSHLFGHINTNADLAPVITPNMPLAREPLSESDQQAFFNWIIQGAKSADGKIAYTDVTKKIFVVNENEDMVSVIDGQTQRLVRIPYIGAHYQPAAIAMTPDLKSYIVAMKGVNGSVVKYDAGSYVNLGEFTTNFSPSEIAITPDAGKGYVSDDSYNRYGVFDPAEMKLSKSIVSPLVVEPSGIAVSPDGRYVYMCGRESDNILRIDTRTDSIVGCITLGPGVPVPVTETYKAQYTPQKIVISADSKTMYISCLNSSEIVVVDLIKDSIVSRIPILYGPWGEALTPDGSELWVADYVSNQVDVISTTTNRVIAKIDSVSQYPHAIAITSDGAFAYIACELSSGGVHHHVTGGLPPSSYVVIDCKKRAVLSIQELPAFSVGIVMGYKN